MAGLDDFIAALEAAKPHLDAASTEVARGCESGDDVASALAYFELPERAEMVRAASDRGREGAAEIATALAALDEAVAAAKRAKGESSPTAGRAAPTAAPASRPTFKPMRTDPQKVAEIKPHVGKDYAVATLFDAKGNRILGPHSASDDGPAKDANWKEPWGSYPRLRRHVEAHTAARMHRDDHKQLAMYINMAPCKYFDGCERNLEALIPEDSTLFVHQVFANRTTQVHMFHGTGEALRSDDGDKS
ncbi:MAG: DddA-like double-stranded DNA deaminase toxin [Stackebrandtia sp.]